MLLKKAISVFRPPTKFLSHKVITLEVKALDTLMPDRLLLLYLNTFDKRVAPKAVNGIISGLDRLPPKVRASLISAADEYVPDAVASSRKASAVVSAVYKYVPDRIIPPQSADDWAAFKTRFHVPTLLLRDRRALEN
jgi:hypothetical protein